MEKVYLELTPEQAQSVSKALDLYSRICIGQFEEIGHLVSMGVVPMRGDSGNERKIADYDVCEQVRGLMDVVKQTMGYPKGGSHGIGHKHNCVDGKRAYEVKKVIDKALAVKREPNPSFPTVDYDGLLVRYTNDTPPKAEVKA